MAVIKSYTDIEQSKKLAEILPLESADMFYNGVQDLDKEKAYNVPLNGSSITLRTRHIITQKGINANLLLPCWSLAALMKIIEIDKSEICFDCYGEKYRVNVHYQTLGSFCQDNELYESKIDALFAMIIKLHKRNLL